MNRTRVCAVVPTFDPGSQVLGCVESLAAQVAQVVVVDDGSEARFEPVLRDLEGRGVHLIRERANRGIAAALNRGIHWAIDQGFEWAITFDQDCAAQPDLVARLIAALEACPDADILLNNNAGPPPGRFEDWDHAHWLVALEANLLTHACQQLPPLPRRAQTIDAV